MGCDCCTYWEEFGECELFVNIVTDTTSINTDNKFSQLCKYKLGRDIAEDNIVITAKLRTGTSTGVFSVTFTPISILYDNQKKSIWQDYTPPSIQVW